MYLFSLGGAVLAVVLAVVCRWVLTSFSVLAVALSSGGGVPVVVLPMVLAFPPLCRLSHASLIY